MFNLNFLTANIAKKDITYKQKGKVTIQGFEKKLCK